MSGIALRKCIDKYDLGKIYCQQFSVGEICNEKNEERTNSNKTIFVLFCFVVFA